MALVRQSNGGTMTGAVHIICATLPREADPAAIEHALTLAGALREANGVRHALVGRSTTALVTVTWLESRDALEPFAASPAHMAFIMRGLAPCISGMWSAAVESDAEPPGEVDALWVFALADAEALYEWQVRDLIRSVDTLPGIAAAGPTIEERERYRAGGVVCVADAERAAFRTAIESARQQWTEIAPVLTQQAVDVVRPTRASG